MFTTSNALQNAGGTTPTLQYQQADMGQKPQVKTIDNTQIKISQHQQVRFIQLKVDYMNFLSQF